VSTTDGLQTRTRSAAAVDHPHGQYVRTPGFVAKGIARPTTPRRSMPTGGAGGVPGRHCGARRTRPGVATQRQSRKNAEAARARYRPLARVERWIQAMHIGRVGGPSRAPYGRWLDRDHPEHLHASPPASRPSPADNDAPETKNNPSRPCTTRTGSRHPPSSWRSLCERERGSWMSSIPPSLGIPRPRERSRPLAGPGPAPGHPGTDGRFVRHVGQARELAGLLGGDDAENWREARDSCAVAANRRTPSERSAPG